MTLRILKESQKMDAKLRLRVEANREVVGSIGDIVQSGVNLTVSLQKGLGDGSG